MSDDWVPIDGFPKYCVNPLGQVMHARTERLVTPQLTQRGVAYVSLVRETRRQFKRSLALLVAKAFIPRPYEVYDTPINLNGDRLNCAVANLMWRPRWFAVLYHQQFKERYFNPITTPVKNMETSETFRDGMDTCIHYGLLERDLFLSIANRTYCWPTYHTFGFLE